MREGVHEVKWSQPNQRRGRTESEGFVLHPGSTPLGNYAPRMVQTSTALSGNVPKSWVLEIPQQKFSFLLVKRKYEGNPKSKV